VCGRQEHEGRPEQREAGHGPSLGRAAPVPAAVQEPSRQAAQPPDRHQDTRPGHAAVRAGERDQRPAQMALRVAATSGNRGLPFPRRVDGIS
jgi:hypothetical protein